MESFLDKASGGVDSIHSLLAKGFHSSFATGIKEIHNSKGSLNHYSFIKEGIKNHNQQIYSIGVQANA